jgi:hypothetical protein
MSTKRTTKPAARTASDCTEPVQPKPDTQSEPEVLTIRDLITELKKPPPTESGVPERPGTDVFPRGLRHSRFSPVPRSYEPQGAERRWPLRFIGPSQYRPCLVMVSSTARSKSTTILAIRWRFGSCRRSRWRSQGKRQLKSLWLGRAHRAERLFLTGTKRAQFRVRAVRRQGLVGEVRFPLLGKPVLRIL